MTLPLAKVMVKREEKNLEFKFLSPHLIVELARLFFRHSRKHEFGQETLTKTQLKI